MTTQAQKIIDTRLNIRVTVEQRDGFAKYCESIGTTPSDEIRRYMVQCAKKNTN